MEDRNYDYLFKLIILGGAGVGKTSFLYRFHNGTFGDRYLSNIGVEFATKIVESEGKKVKLQTWDTAGQERFLTITRSYFRGAHGVVVMYDITRRSSFEQLTEWLQQIDRYAPPHCQKIILGNKSDLAEEGGGRGREVEEDEGREYAEGLPVAIPFLEISVKEGIGIEEAFDLLVLNIKHWYDEDDHSEVPSPILNSQPNDGCIC